MFFRPSNALLLAGAKLKSTYKSLELTTAARFPTVIHHTPTKFYNRGGQTCSMYEPHIIKPKLQEPQHKNLKTRIYLQSTLL